MASVFNGGGGVMGKEIERKFLLSSSAWRQQVVRSARYRQGYLANNGHASVRVRVAGEQANINIKSATLGIERMEYEYPIPLDEAEEMLDQLCSGPLIDKVRHFVEIGDHIWEIDVFSGDNQGLEVAEIELGSSDELFERPDWLGDEVSADPRYYNVCLVDHPYKDW